MMRYLPAALLLLGACGGAEPLGLPTDPVDRAATCGVVAAATARMSVPDVQAPLPLEAQGRILHYALLAASEGGEFQPEIANRVSRRMGELQERITGGKWRELIPACEGAYPPLAKTEIELPAARLDAQLVCEELAQFVATAMEGQGSDYVNELATYRVLRRELNDALASGLRARAGASLEAQRRERHRALAEAARLGSPIPVLERCQARFGNAGQP